jgi:hypothetical protein
VLSVAGIFFPPLEAAAAVLETISLVSSFIAASADTVLAATGKGSWTAVGLDALTLLPMGLAKVVTKAAPAIREGRFLRPTDVAHASTGIGGGAGGLSAEAGRSWANPATLLDHFNRHGADFSTSTPSEYADLAAGLLRRSKTERLPTKIDRSGTVRIYEPSTNSFGSYTADGRTRTFYKPDPKRHRMPDNWTYWLSQKGDDVSHGD